MKRFRTAGGILVAIEVLVLIIVLIVVLLRPLQSAGSKDERDWASELKEFETEEGIPTTDGVDAEDTEGASETEIDPMEQTASTSSEQQEVTRLVFSDDVEDKMADMTVEELVAQMFLITPEALTGVSNVTAAGDGTDASIKTFPVGGLVYSSSNFTGKTQTKSLLANVQSYMQDRIGIMPFLAVEEIGGTDASPVASKLGYSVAGLPSEWQTADVVRTSAQGIADCLNELGFNLNLGIVADVSDDTDSEAAGFSLGTDVNAVAELLESEIAVYEDAGLATALQAFPAHTGAEWDDASSCWVSSRSLSEIESNELAVIQTGVASGADLVMVSFVSNSELTGSSVPCCLSGTAVSELRNTVGDATLIMTDDLSDESITAHYSAAEAAVAAVTAGVDILYRPENFEEAYQAVVDAVNSGDISKDLIENAVGRILTRKFAM